MSFATWESDDSDDDWFYESIKRYEDLSIYDVQGTISCATFSNEKRLLLATARENVAELWELSVSEKITAGKDAGLTNDRDFRLITAGYTLDNVKEMVYIESGVVTSGSKGVFIYNIPNAKAESDVIKQVGSVRCDTVNASLVNVGTSLYSCTNLNNLTCYDLHTQNVASIPFLTHNQKNLSNNSASSVSRMSFASENIYLGLRESGAVYTLDPRTRSVMQVISQQEKESGDWICHASVDGKHVAVANCTGSFSVFDTRNTAKLVFSRKIQPIREGVCHHHIQFSPSGNFMSLSGFNSFVEVFEVQKGCWKEENYFLHDGHRRKEVTEVLTHLWHPTCSKLVLSADNTGQLQAWRFM